MLLASNLSANATDISRYKDTDINNETIGFSEMLYAAFYAEEKKR